MPQPPPPAWTVRLVAAAIAGAFVLGGLDVPLVEDGLFWWVPKALWLVERGPAWAPAGDLPQVVAAGLAGHDPVPQWGAGLPDWDHPPLWYGWLALFLAASPTVQAVHLACLPFAVLAAVGWVALAERLHRPWAGLAVLGLPPVLAQFLRPDHDLPLLAAVPWALCALLDGRWARFALMGLVLPWWKEPGVLLVAPALLAAGLPGRPGFVGRAAAACSPLAGLLAWRLVHGHLASPERLPANLGTWLLDLGVVARIALWDQGRFVLPLLGLPLLARRLHRGLAPPGPAALVLAFAAVWLAFFAAVGFFATLGHAQPLTHLRYFLPGLCALVVLLCTALPALGLAGLFYLVAPSPNGPEASLWGLQAALAERAAAPWIGDRLDAGDTLWVGSYQAAGLLQPWAGIVPRALPPQGATGGRLRIYGIDTVPEELAVGDILVVAAYGEPSARLQRALRVSELGRWTRGTAAVTAFRVEGPSAPPR